MKPTIDRLAAGRPRLVFWRTLRFRFASWVASFLLVLLILFGVFIYARLSQGLWASTDDKLRLGAAQTMAALTYDGHQIRLTENTVTGELQERGVTIRLFTPAGEMIQALGAFATLPLNPETVQQHQEVFSTVQDPYDDEHIRFYSVPVIRDGAVIGMVEVAESLEQVDDTLVKLKTVLLIGVPLLSLTAGGGSYLLAARALARIDQITTAVRRISAEDLSTRLGFLPVDDEVGRLAATFDEMLTRLDASFERERRFTADASHELRTPVTAIQVIASTTLEKQRSPADYEQALVDIAEEADRLRALAEDLLVLERGDNHQPIAREPVDLALLLQDVTESLRPLAEAKGLTLSLDAADSLSLQGDRDQLLRLFVNLLDNAIKYTKQGKIAVRAQRATDGWLQVSIADTGVGIAAEHLPHLFERFFRVETSRTTPGVGLGLTIAQEIADAHGGTVEVTSDVGIGTIFVVRLQAP
jgi:heavy metal sensor kinase